jgi:hypothetical protein
MKNSFGKHFASMYEGSLVGKGSVVFAVMGYVIANQSPELGESGERLMVRLNPALLGVILGDGAEAVQVAIDFLCRPDKKSHKKAEQGRRLVKQGEFDYWVVNGRYYRQLGSEERRREQNREAQQRFRDKEKELRGREISGPNKGKTIEQAIEDAHEDGPVVKREILHPEAEAEPDMPF